MSSGGAGSVSSLTDKINYSGGDGMLLPSVIISETGALALGRLAFGVP